MFCPKCKSERCYVELEGRKFQSCRCKDCLTQFDLPKRPPPVKVDVPGRSPFGEEDVPFIFRDLKTEK